MSELKLHLETELSNLIKDKMKHYKQIEVIRTEEMRIMKELEKLK